MAAFFAGLYPGANDQGMGFLMNVQSGVSTVPCFTGSPLR